MIAVNVGDDDHVQMCEIDMHRLDVLSEDFDVVARIEEDALAFELDQGGITPVLLKAGPVPKSVVQDRHPVLRPGENAGRYSNEAKQRPQNQTTSTEHGEHPFFNEQDRMTTWFAKAR